jgi:K+-sensing histidine kinase KdpD
LILESVLRLAEANTKSHVDLSNVPLHSVVGRVVTAHRRRNPHRAITMRGDTPLYARANSMWVELALSNLINNAEKYTPHDRTIEINFHQNGSNATILVLDNGNGLPAESYRGLWDVYYRGGSPEVVIGGSGIGLALCKELIEGMGGQVWAGPRKAGGSVFALSLPMPVDKAIPAPLGTRISTAPIALLLSDQALTAWA